MEVFLEILKYTLPAIIVFLTAFLLIGKFIDNEQKKMRIELRANNRKQITPIRLQAYERIVLFLERIAPNALIMRSQQPGMTAKKLQTDLLSLIRAEFEHNLSQQIYMSAQTWNVIKNTKENTVKLINTAADKVDPKAPSIELSKKILETLMDMEIAPNQIAIDFVKKEVGMFF